MWTLFLCPTIVWGMCGTIQTVDYQSKADCLEAIELTLKNSKEKPALIRCQPKQNP